MIFDLRGRRRRPAHIARGDAYALLELEQRIFSRKGMCLVQHDMDIANGSGATVRADINNALDALATFSSGATEPGTTQAYQAWADTTAGLMKQRNSANTGWKVRGTLAETLAVARSLNTIIVAGDFGKTFICTGTFTQTLTAAATLGDGFMFWIRNNGAGVITIDPNLTEKIDNATTITLSPRESCLIFCDGSNFVTIGRAKGRTRQIFTTGSGTYNTPVDATMLLVRLVGAGGSGATSGAAGGNTTFGTLTGNGGNGAGVQGGAGGAGGAASGGDVNIPGGAGNGAAQNSSTSVALNGVAGGNSVFGGAGGGGQTSATGTAATANSGSGGGSDGVGTAISGRPSGGAGGYVEKLILAPAATYSYAIGAGGVGGTGGQSGAAGIIIVDEFYN